MQYPGRVIKMGEQDASLLKVVKQRLNEALNLTDDPERRLDPADPTFGQQMKQMVLFFQARNVDHAGRPLQQDGTIGPLTWAALFGDDTVPVNETAKTPLLAKVLHVAAGEEAKHVREIPRNSNRGPDVEKYQRAAGAAPGNAWCCAFVYWCFNEASHEMACKNPMVKTAGCLDHWERAAAEGARRVPSAAATEDPALVEPGMVFVIDHGHGLGHTGLVEKVAGGLLTTIEGNTDASKTREGGGVYRLTRGISEINTGFIDYARKG